MSLKVIKKFPDLKPLKNAVDSLKISPQEIFDKIAIDAVQNKNLDTLKFLVDECKFDLSKITDPKQRTLLHEACLVSNSKIVSYLLDKNFNPNAQDSQGDTSLHRAVQKKENTMLISILIESKANLNIKNNQGLTPLFTAALCKNSEASLELIKQGASTSLKCNGLTYFQFKKLVEQGACIANFPTEDLTLTKKITDQNLAKYLRASLPLHFEQQFFLDYITSLLKSSTLISPAECCFLVHALILTNKFPLQPKVIISEIERLVQSKTLSWDVALFPLLTASQVFAEMHQIGIVIEFNDFVVKSIEKKEVSSENIVDFYELLGCIYNKIGLFREGEYFLKKAILGSSRNTSNQLKMQFYYNLGFAQFSLWKEEEALKSFENAYYFDKNDMDSFQYYLLLLAKLRKYDQAIIVCEDSIFDEISRINIAFVHHLAGDISTRELLKIIDVDFVSTKAKILALDIKANCHILTANYEQARIAAEQSFELYGIHSKNNKEIDIPAAIYKLLEVYLRAGNYALGLQVAEKLEEKYPFEFSYSILCSCVKSMLFLTNQQFEKAEILIQKIGNSGTKFQSLSNLYLSIAIEIISTNENINYDKAIKYIDLTLALDPDNFKSKLYKLLLCILQENQPATKEILQSIRPELLTDPSVIKDLKKGKEPGQPYDLTESSQNYNKQEDEEVLLEDDDLSFETQEYDPVKIHHYFQTEKARIFSELLSSLSSTPKPNIKWNIGSVCFEEGKNGLTRIQHPRYLNCYAVIDPQLKLPFLEKFETALNKKNTIKTINKSIVELKINADNRLWTNTIYCNDDKYLIVFDHHGLHPQVKRKARQSEQIKVINLTENPDPFINKSHFSGAFFSSTQKKNIVKKQSEDQLVSNSKLYN